MAIIAQKRLFGWEEMEELGDLERLRLVLDHLPDEEMMRELEGARGRGRDDYPVRAVWNSVLSGIVFGHESVESLRRELLRNGQLRVLCGFDPLKGSSGVPPSWVYTRFLKVLLGYRELIEGMLDRLVEELRKVLPDFGRRLAVDSKAVLSHGRGKKEEKGVGVRDGRGEQDADFGKKTIRRRRKDGSVWEKVKSWFGFKIHLMVDADYELPVGFEVTKASVADIKAGKELFESVARRHEGLVEEAGELSGDKGYDDTEWICHLWEMHGIKPVIDIRNMWKDGEATKVVEGRKNVVYDFRGTVSCHCPVTDERRDMAFGGFEKDRDALKYRCPARHYGLECRGLVCVPDGGFCADSIVRRPPHFHAVGPIQLCLETRLSAPDRRGAGQQSSGCFLWIRASLHPRFRQDAPASGAGALRDAGHGPGASKGEAERTHAKPGPFESRLEDEVRSKYGAQGVRCARRGLIVPQSAPPKRRRPSKNAPTTAHKRSIYVRPNHKALQRKWLNTESYSI